MKFYFDKRVLIGFSISMLVLIILGVFLYISTHRKQVSFTVINMKKTFEDIVREQASELRDRKLDIKIQDMECAKGDLSMIRQMWINLISNALKFSSKKDISQLEIGFFKRDGNVVYYGSDNGTGFDMKCGDKLFGVFQRLHEMNELEGTGVGLALVKTVIKRYGVMFGLKANLTRVPNFTFHLIY